MKARTYKTTEKQRAVSDRWYQKNRQRHIEAVRARFKRQRPDVDRSDPPITVEQIRARAALLYGTVYQGAAS